LLDRLLHHAVVIRIEGNSYRLREHDKLLPEHLRARAVRDPNPPLEFKRRGRVPAHGVSPQPGQAGCAVLSEPQPATESEQYR
jgi:hypothetical protein